MTRSSTEAEKIRNGLPCHKLQSDSQDHTRIELHPIHRTNVPEELR